MSGSKGIPSLNLFCNGRTYDKSALPKLEEAERELRVGFMYATGKVSETKKILSW